MHGRRILLPSCLVLGLAIAVLARATVHAGPAPLASKTPSAPIDVTLDRAGRPYDTALAHGARLVRRPLVVLHAPSARVLVTGGENVMYVGSGDADAIQLAERPGRQYPVDAIWLDRKGTRLDEIVGVVLVERSGVVKRWKELERGAYTTDGGVGGITTPEWAAKPKGQENEVSNLYWRELVDKGRQWFAADVDGSEGPDTLVFSNGFGDGYFPSVAGYDATGRRLEIAFWSIAAPWRLAFPEGTPPPQVTARERALAECLEGKRRIDGNRCRLAQ